ENEAQRRRAALLRSREPACGEQALADTPRPNEETIRRDATLGRDSSLPPQVGGYDILAGIGRGGMGGVYKARHRRLHRLAALKMVLSGQLASPTERLRFQLEAELAARVQHPNIVQVYEVGTHEGQLFLAMEWIEGGTLAGQRSRWPLPPREAAQLVETLARAIEAAHAQGVIHRDLKPANVLLQGADRGMQEEQGAILKIADFGLARL